MDHEFFVSLYEEGMDQASACYSCNCECYHCDSSCDCYSCALGGCY